MIQGDFQDAYENLSYKTVFGHLWVSKWVTYIKKTSDTEKKSSTGKIPSWTNRGQTGNGMHLAEGWWYHIKRQIRHTDMHTCIQYT